MVDVKKNLDIDDPGEFLDPIEQQIPLLDDGLVLPGLTKVDYLNSLEKLSYLLC